MCTDVRVHVCDRESERQSDNSLGAALIGSNGFLCWGGGLVRGSNRLMFGSYSNDYST